VKKDSLTQTYKVLDAGEFEKLEQIGSFIFRRPCPQAVWKKTLSANKWNEAEAVFNRDKSGSGNWSFKNKKFADSNLVVSFAGFLAKVTFTSFGHLGFFIEHQKNWEFIQDKIMALKEKGVSEPRVLNLFAYTGLLSVVCARAGAVVTHVDSSKSSVSWAEANFELNGIERKRVRCIVEDVRAFVKKELKRGSKYHGIILDPPSFGRGEKSQVWKIEENLSEVFFFDFEFPFTRLYPYCP
jgi:23S rRNA (cytosine1962-C5)-methyltransferase